MTAIVSLREFLIRMSFLLPLNLIVVVVMFWPTLKRRHDERVRDRSQRR